MKLLLAAVAVLSWSGCTIYEAPPPASPGACCAAGPPPGGAGGIRILAGTYGANCGAPVGNVTAHVTGACDGRAACDYRVDYTVIGDPAVGCQKDYVVDWRCDGSPEIHRASAPPEAGFRSIVALSCGGARAAVASPPPPPPAAYQPGGIIEVVAGTYGANCRAAYANKTAPLATACNGRTQCDYRIDHTVIGDPAVGCQKDYVAEWRCSGSPIVHRVSAPPEAGFGSVVTLSCGRRP